MWNLQHIYSECLWLCWELLTYKVGLTDTSSSGCGPAKHELILCFFRALLTQTCANTDRALCYLTFLEHSSHSLERRKHCERAAISQGAYKIKVW